MRMSIFIVLCIVLKDSPCTTTAGGPVTRNHVYPVQPG